MSVSTQLVWLFVLGAPVACVAWTVTHEDVFADARRLCMDRSRHGRRWLERKFFYLFTCEYCFSHYVALAGVLLIDLRLLVPGWRGTLLAWFATVWVANVYMGLFARLRLDIKRERTGPCRYWPPRPWPTRRAKCRASQARGGASQSTARRPVRRSG